ncbi:antitoxin [Salinifilum aidingensis]
MSMMDKLKGFLGKSPDKAKQGIDKAASFADEKTGGKYSDKINQFSEKAHGYVDAQGEQSGEQQGSEQQDGSTGSGGGEQQDGSTGSGGGEQQDGSTGSGGGERRQ